MTAAAISLRSKPRARAALVRLELRRNPMAWMLVPIVALFWLTAYRQVTDLPAFWPVRCMDLEFLSLLSFAPLTTGVAAWAGSRDGRRRITDLVNVTARPRWAAKLTAWAAVTGWAVAGYVICTGAVYIATARQGAPGGPLWWPPAVGVATVGAVCAIGFAAGALWPSRFTPPLTAIVVFGSMLATGHPPGNTRYALISPFNSSLGLNLFPDIGVFYHYVPDLAIDQLLFLGGLTAVSLGSLGLPAVSGSHRLRRIAAGIAAAGVATAGTAAGLASTARFDGHGMYDIPALHDAASDQPLRYTPVCTGSVVRICVQPSFRGYLPAVAAALAPVLREVAGLPGAPVAVTQVDTAFSLNDAGFPVPGGGTVSGRPPVLRVPLGWEISWAGSSLDLTIAPPIVASVIGGTSQAQQAVQAALLTGAGIHLITAAQAVHESGVAGPAPGSAVDVAAIRFAALPAGARHAWLTTHLTALRAGRVTLAELP